MSLTRITSAVLSSNAVSAEKLANGSLTARTLANGAIEARHLAPSANLVSSVGTVQDNLTANVTQITANLNLTSTNVAAVSANVDIVSSNVGINSANTIQNKANVDIANANTIQINSNLNVVQDNVALIHSGSQEFTVNKIFQQNVTVQGNLIVVGSQVDLGVGTATVDDNFIVVGANLTGTPATDSGLVINRGSEGNVFIGDHIGDEGVVFAITDSPHDNATIAIKEYMDVHANAFHAESGMNFTRVHFGHVADETTGVIVDTTNTHIKFIAGGAEEGNITSDGDMFMVRNFFSGNAVISTKLFAGEVDVKAGIDDVSSNVEDVSGNLQANVIQLVANINTVSGNVDAGVGLLKEVNAITSTGSNVFYAKVPSGTQHPTNIANVNVFIDGLRQKPDNPGTSNNDFVYNTSDASVTITDPSLPSGLEVLIDVLAPRPA